MRYGNHLCGLLSCLSMNLFPGPNILCKITFNFLFLGVGMCVEGNRARKRWGKILIKFVELHVMVIFMEYWHPESNS